MSDLVNCIDGLTASDIIKAVAKTANGTPFYLSTLGGDPCADYSNILINSGGEVGGVLCADDWVDTNTDGLADDWVQFTGAGAPAIVTGNGFLGNAQRINHVNGTQTQFFQNTGVNAEIGETYRLRLKYRTNDGSSRIYLRSGADAFILNLPINAGDAIQAEYTVGATVANQITCTIIILPGRPNNYLEIDDVIIVKL